MRALVLTAALLSSLGASGCGTTHILTTDPTARIFVDGRPVGQGQADIDKRGTPGSAVVVVKTADGRQQQSTIQRSFTGTTLLAGFFTYGICLFACWEYPEMVFLPLPQPPPPPPPVPGTNVAAAGDPWLTPPAGWTPHPAPAPTGGADPPAH